MEYTVNLGKESLKKIGDAISGKVEVEPLEVTENGEYTAPSGKAYSPVSVNVAGGGGSSDFSTAEVTIKYFDTDTPYSFDGVGVYEGGALSTGANLHNLGEDWAGELLVNSWVYFETAIVNVTVTGDIEVVEIFDGGHACLIHGDGVITITSVTAPV